MSTVLIEEQPTEGVKRVYSSSPRYPTTPDAEGFFYHDDLEEALGVHTKKYDNGNIVKRVEMSDGRQAVLHELTGDDVMNAYRMVGGKGGERDIMKALMSLALKVNGESVLFDEIGNLKARDFMKLMKANALINFL